MRAYEATTSLPAVLAFKHKKNSWSWKISKQLQKKLTKQEFVMGYAEKFPKILLGI